MEIIVTFFNYIYYRICERYYKSDGELAIRALISISGFQAVIVGCLTIRLLKFFLHDYQIIAFSGIITNVIVVGFGGVFMIVNYHFYKGKYEIFHEKWKYELQDSKTLKGYIIVLILFAPYLLLYIVMNY